MPRTRTELGKERQKLALELKLKGLSYREIGERLGVSRQRAQQLVCPDRATWLSVKQYYNSRCAYCLEHVENGHVHHVEYDNDINNMIYLCQGCHARGYANL